jgi:putative RecB family exonuclease
MAFKKQSSLSPSRISTFKQCPYRFKLQNIDKILEPATVATFKGTIVHKILELIFDYPYLERTEEKALSMIDEAIQKVLLEDEKAKVLYEDESVDKVEYRKSIEEMLHAYFGLEDPRKYEPYKREGFVSYELNDDLKILGYVDRIDRTPTGNVRIIDYKTGKMPAPQFSADYIFQLNFYAYIYKMTNNVLPDKVELIFMGNPNGRLPHKPNNDELEQIPATALNIFAKIKEFVNADNFPTTKNNLCDWCFYKKENLCPEFGGTKTAVDLEKVKKAFPTGIC